MKMNFSFPCVKLIFLMCFFLSFNSELIKKAAVATAAKTDDVITDKEIQELLKDPKYADIANNPEMLKSFTASLKDEPLTTTPSATVHKGRPTPVHHVSPHPVAQADASHFSLYVTILQSPFRKNEKGDHTVDLMLGQLPHHEAQLPIKDDLLKDLNIDTPPLKPNLPPHSSKKHKESIAKEDQFKDFDFLSKQQARYLIEILKQPMFLKMLPQEAANMIKTVKDNFSFKTIDNDKMNTFIENSLVTSPSSQTFIDSDGK